MLYRRKSESCDKFNKKMCIFNQNYLPGGGNFIFFINENNFLVLKRGKYDGIRTLRCPAGTGALFGGHHHLRRSCFPSLGGTLP